MRDTAILHSTFYILHFPLVPFPGLSPRAASGGTHRLSLAECVNYSKTAALESSAPARLLIHLLSGIAPARAHEEPPGDWYRQDIAETDYAEREPEIGDEERNKKEEARKDKRHSPLRDVDVL